MTSCYVPFGATSFNVKSYFTIETNIKKIINKVKVVCQTIIILTSLKYIFSCSVKLHILAHTHACVRTHISFFKLEII